MERREQQTPANLIQPPPPPPYNDTRTHLSNLERLLRKHPSPCRRRFLSDLRLPLQRLFPQSDTDDICFSNLCRALSNPTRHPIPRQSIASLRWRDLHGRAGLSGLVDPLDTDLRCELLRYGRLIQTIYHAFLNSASFNSPDRHYRITRTSSRHPPSFPRAGPASTSRVQLVGFVAVCDSDAETVEWAAAMSSSRYVARPPAWSGLRTSVSISSLSTPVIRKWRAGSEPVYDRRRRRAEPVLSSSRGGNPTADNALQRTAAEHHSDRHSLGAAIAYTVADDLIAGGTEISTISMPPIAVFLRWAQGRKPCVRGTFGGTEGAGKCFAW
ncbi:hypothetical protein KSP40_PGU008788 [Platanthera guangdongensis]|uniref:Uncharacterized protein n=1 Tax=Platanthera guangdongensis TaxID=2320717 RepID=A0ABR2LHG1_9ASPA